MTDACVARTALEPTDRLFVQNRKRLSQSYVINEDGVRELRIDYGLKEISFDEERLFPFGEHIVKAASFTGEEAMSWGPGYQWEELQPLLEALLEERIIKQGDAGDDFRGGGGIVASPLPPSVCPMPRSWSATECESITRDLVNRPIEIGYLEAVVPAFRIAHPALDADHRQVGEANVFPPALRLDRDTEWRVCQYSGSRYRDDAPMNVTALKAMIKHWKPMMVTLLAVREEIKERILGGRERWSIGDLHTLSCVVLALTAFPLMKRGGASPQPLLHPVLSSLFRITDGIRMTTYEMLFLLAEKPRNADDEMTAAELYSYAEQHGVFISDTGVCAGPKALIEEFLTVAVDGTAVEGLDGAELAPDVRAVLAELPVVVDYGLSGLQVWGLSHSLWLAMSRAFEAILGLLEPEASRAIEGGPLARLLGQLRTGWATLKRMQLTLEYDREVHQRAYSDAYERSWRGLSAPVGKAMLAEEISPISEGDAHRAAIAELSAAICSRCSELGAEAASISAGVAEALVRYLRQEQAVLSSVSRVLASINTMLDRPRPARALSARDFQAYYLLSGGAGFPYLLDTFHSAMGLEVDCAMDAIEIAVKSAA
jgi:hypothetical protein